MSSPDATTAAGEHIVVFYRNETELADQVASFLHASFTDAGAAVAVATPAHERLIRARLEQAGVDVVKAWSDGRYLPLDAEGTLAKFMIGDLPDPASFWQVIGDVVRQASAQGQVVRIYGEMVALLWHAGRVDAAIELEALWNELGAQYDFALACGYPAAEVSGESNSDALAEVCDAHTAVVGAPGPAS